MGYVLNREQMPMSDAAGVTIIETRGSSTASSSRSTTSTTSRKSSHDQAIADQRRNPDSRSNGRAPGMWMSRDQFQLLAEAYIWLTRT